MDWGCGRFRPEFVVSFRVHLGTFNALAVVIVSVTVAVRSMMALIVVNVPTSIVHPDPGALSGQCPLSACRPRLTRGVVVPVAASVRRAVVLTRSFHFVRPLTAVMQRTAVLYYVCRCRFQVLRCPSQPL